MLLREGGRTQERLFLATKNKVEDKFPSLWPRFHLSNMKTLAMYLQHATQRKAPKATYRPC